MTPSERSMQLRLAAHISWTNTPDRASRTAAARRASHHTRFVEMARERYPDASEEQIANVAASLKKAHYQQLALRSAQARRLKGQAVKEALRRQQADELAAYEADKTSAA